MFSRQTPIIKKLREVAFRNSSTNSIVGNELKHRHRFYSTGQTCTEFPRKLKKTERKPWVTNINELKRIGRAERKDRQVVRERILQPPENGLLVKELIPVAHQVYAARSELFACVSKVAQSIALYSCSVCGEVHIGHPPHNIRTCNVMGSAASKEHSWKRGDVELVLPLVESFHLYDRLGRAVSHNERLQVDRIPAILELCVQAGINFSEYPTRRRVFPAYSISGRIIDFERRFPKEDAPGKDINAYGFWQKRNKTSDDNKFVDLQPGDLQGIAVCGMEAWERMRTGASRLMQKYAVQTCGHCSEVQVGPKGHRVRNCQAYKHQMRDGQHAWQEATIDDLIPPVYVWHIRDHQSEKPLVNDLKRYYGMLPAVVELFAQGGASVPGDYAGMMREDVALPEADEEMLTSTMSIGINYCPGLTRHQSNSLPLLSSFSSSFSAVITFRSRSTSFPLRCLPLHLISLSRSDMDTSAGPSLFPLHHCKTLHLVRHAQGIHNVEGDKNYKAYMSPEYFDARITPLGWQQVDNLRKHVHESGLAKRIDLVIVSPLLRTLQTAVGVFGGEGYTDRMDIVPLMVANAGNSGRAAISSLNSPPIIAVELCREHLGVHPCDKRRNISDYQFLFPAVDFSLIESDEDTLWKADIRETKEEVAARGLKFLNWLWTRKEKEIAIVTHSGFLFHTLSAFGNDCHPLVKKEICKHFANCELRSMVIVDRSMMGLDPSTTNYPGKIPPGPDLPSHVVDEKAEEKRA
ncbi:hypothetical protein DITRI_Ditri01bG0080800 [Diplodiscus trichospermus]